MLASAWKNLTFSNDPVADSFVESAKHAEAVGLLEPVENPGGIFDLAHDHGGPTALRDLGMPAERLDRAADLAVENRYPNPRALERAALRELLQRAWEGTRPE